MLKVFLVEDEFAMRERMKKNIDWEGNGFLLVGEAGDGELAYSMIQQLKPDILITDIKMPFMNGLELTTLLKSSMPNLKIIILSGYDEFEYAKEALRLGVTDYLLKPITSKKIIESLHAVASLIEQQRSQEKKLQAYQAEIAKNYENSKKTFFNHLISNTWSVQSLIEEAKTLNLDIMAMSYNIILIKMSHGVEAASINEEDPRQFIYHYLSLQSNILVCERDNSDYLIVVKGGTSGTKKTVDYILAGLTDLLQSFFTVQYYMGIGEEIYRMSEIKTAYELANQALAYRYFIKETNVFYYEQVKDFLPYTPTESITFADLDISKQDGLQLESFLYDGNVEDVNAFTNLYFNRINTALNSRLIRQYIIMEVYFILIAFYKKLNVPSERIQSVFKNEQKINVMLNDKQLFKATIQSWVNEALTIRDSQACKGYGRVIAQVKHYLQENYNKEGLSLNQVADYVNISPSHLSALFSQETGQTFISYLTEIRMEKAKELLRCTNMKTLEIGYEVGYKDAHYFSVLFKKTQNCTPKEYRRQVYEL